MDVGTATITVVNGKAVKKYLVGGSLRYGKIF